MAANGNQTSDNLTTDAIRDLQDALGLPATGRYCADTGMALWDAIRTSKLSPSDGVVCAARAQVETAFYGVPPRESLEGAGPATPPSVAGPLQDRLLPYQHSSIIIGGRQVPLPAGSPLHVVPYKMWTLPAGPRRQKPCQIILHHDAADSARACYQILKARKLSTHFAIDDSGIVLQFADPARDRTWHAVGHMKEPGGAYVETGFSARSIGIDFSNPVIVDSEAGRRDTGRPLIADRVHGRPYRGLGMFEVQIEAALELLRALCAAFPDIDPTQYRTDLEWPGTIGPETPGIWGHLHVNKGKVDPWGFPWHRLAEVAAARIEARAT